MTERGMALIAALWTIAIIGSVAGTGLAVARDAVAASRYRVDARRARWQVEGCLAEFRRGVERGFVEGRVDTAQWVVPSGCDIAVSQDSGTVSVLVQGLWRGAALVDESWVVVGARVGVVRRAIR